jgi:hypothetical protein
MNHNQKEPSIFTTGTGCVKNEGEVVTVIVEG